MGGCDFSEPAKLTMPHRRDELILYLKELAMPDPRGVWREETERGLVSGIDQVFHFFFDDNDFDETAIGVMLLSQSEVAAIQNVKAALEAILESVGDEGDDVFAQHPLWPQVTAAASHALTQLEAKA
jgi:hypothetical protein